MPEGTPLPTQSPTPATLLLQEDVTQKIITELIRLSYKICVFFFLVTLNGTNQNPDDFDGLEKNFRGKKKTFNATESIRLIRPLAKVIFGTVLKISNMFV